MILAKITHTTKPLLRPLAYKIDASDFKSALTEGLSEKPWHEGEEDEQPVYPIAWRWSLWKQVDPVALFEGWVVWFDENKDFPGFAASYHH